MFYFEPSTDYRLALTKGMRGTDVAALQLNLAGVEVDGIFGKETKRAVKRHQIKNKILPKGHEYLGLVGPGTQHSLCIKRSTKACRRYELPVGLGESLLANESGFVIAAVTLHPSDSGYDVGAWQRSSGPGPGTQDFLQDAYTISVASEISAKNIRRAYDDIPDPVSSSYLEDLALGNKARFRWQLAVLSHNWPVATHNLPRIGTILKTPGADDRPAEWIIEATRGRLRTPREWVTSYIERCTTYVKW